MASNRPCLEEIINRVVFGIPNPKMSLGPLIYSCQFDGKAPYNDSKRLIKVVLSDDPQDAVYFKNESPFDVNNSELENICTLMCKLETANVH